MKPKQLVSTGKVIWIEAEGVTSSPLRFVLEDDTLYFLRNAKYERIPELVDGQKVRVVGHPLSKQTKTGDAEGRVDFVSPDEVPKTVLLDLSGTMYDGRLSPDDNFGRLRSVLQVARLDLL